ncbi:MAG: hypothetical protein RDU13_10950 [Elusimicrobiales bacterium]|nr:hypothetical protein [Elusimicrobiales bacterium]
MSKKNKPQPDVKPGPRFRYAVPAAVLGAALLLFARWGFVVTVSENNGRWVVASHQAVEEDFAHPSLARLREREKLQNLKAGRSQLETMVALRGWARRQWEPGQKFRYPPWDALEILDLARRGNRGFCAQFGVVYAQAAMALGLHARYIDIVGHFVTEVWSDELGKWVVMDPYVDLHYERNGVPLNARELCEVHWGGKEAEVFKVGSDWKKTRAEKKDLELYRKYALYLRSNQLANPVTVDRGGRQEKLVKSSDITRYPLIGGGASEVTYVHTIVSFNDAFAKEKFTAWPVLDDLRVYDRPVNQAIIDIAGTDPDGTIRIALVAEGAPDLEGFLFRFNDGPWSAAPARLMGRLAPGLNVLSARVRTRAGWTGPESSVTLLYKPRWFSSGKSY